jgi:Ca2+-binding RTX toxin-like protein
MRTSIALPLVLLAVAAPSTASASCTVNGAMIVGTEIVGTAGSDVIACNDADVHVIWAGAGDDQVTGGYGADEIHGGDGRDYLWADADMSGVIGGDDLVYGEGGNDFELWGSAGRDVLSGGPGDEPSIMGGGGDDVILADPGSDRIWGDDCCTTGFDVLDASAAPAAITADLARQSVRGWGNDTVQQIERVVGTPFADTLRGGAGADELFGLGGADSLSGSSGDDLLDGGDGRDDLNGGTGSDACRNGERTRQCER